MYGGTNRYGNLKSGRTAAVEGLEAKVYTLVKRISRLNRYDCKVLGSHVPTSKRPQQMRPEVPSGRSEENIGGMIRLQNNVRREER